MVKRRAYKLVLALLGILVIATGAALLRSDQAAAQIGWTFPADGSEIGATGRVGIAFNQPMQQDQVDQRIKITPEAPGHATWTGNTLWYVFDAALKPGITYHFTLEAGALAQDGRAIPQDRTVSYKVRSPEIIFLSSQAGQNELWTEQAGGGSLRKLTSTGGKVYDYAPSPDGEQIVYSVTNAQGGSDLWLMQRDGSQNMLLVDCGLDHCSQPAWKPDGTEIAYYRAVTAPNQMTISGIWGVDVVSGQTDFMIYGEQPAWSPDGSWIAVIDPGAGNIHILNVEDGKGIEVSASSDSPPVWIPNSTILAYVDLQSAQAQSTTALLQVDAAIGQVMPLLANLPEDQELSLPAYSPDGSAYIIAMRSFISDLSKQLYYMPPGGKDLQQITKEPSYSNAHFSWNLWGTEAVFQRVQLGSSSAAPQVVTWDRDTGSLQVVALDAALPAWLP